MEIEDVGPIAELRILLQLPFQYFHRRAHIAGTGMRGRMLFAAIQLVRCREVARREHIARFRLVIEDLRIENFFRREIEIFPHARELALEKRKVESDEVESADI